MANVNKTRMINTAISLPSFSLGRKKKKARRKYYPEEKLVNQVHVFLPSQL